jgi:toxin-antitoxin system PIN domain toxin
MRSLFDINVLLALMDPDHVHHERVRSWWAREREHGWASCPISQNGFIRVISQRSYTSSKPIADAIAILRRATSRPDHQFWPDDISILDREAIDSARLLGPSQLTDVYLLALSTRRGGRFATLDRGISTAAVRDAGSENLVVV